MLPIPRLRSVLRRVAYITRKNAQMCVGKGHVPQTTHTSLPLRPNKQAFRVRRAYTYTKKRWHLEKGRGGAYTMNVCTQNKKFRCLQKENMCAYTRKYIHPYKEITRLRNETQTPITAFYFAPKPNSQHACTKKRTRHNKMLCTKPYSLLACTKKHMRL